MKKTLSLLVIIALTSGVTYFCTIKYQKAYQQKHHEKLVEQLEKRNLTCYIRGNKPTSKLSSIDIYNCIIIANFDDQRYTMEVEYIANSEIHNNVILGPSYLSDAALEYFLK